MPIKLFDSLTREIRELRRPDPNNPKDVFSFYNCGPTVYGPAHIGNFRTFVVNDVLRRLLELEYGPGKVKHVRNLTDVDDRTIAQVKKEKRPLAEITKKWTDKFHADCDALNCLRPHVEPTATGHIREQIDMIDVLMKKGNAYRAPDGSVYFKIASFPDYGRLSRIKERELKVTNTIADADHKDSVSDFALWKAYKPEEDGDVKWPGPDDAAAGRPGWHIECSAMIKKHLGDTIDLHTGGVDLLFPHHENEIAQSECCNGTTFARHWYHTEHLLVEGTTMSRSKGNYYVLDDLVAKGYSPMAVRYALLMGHPRKQLNFTPDSLRAAESALQKLKSLGEAICEAARIPFDELYSRAFFSSIASKDLTSLAASLLPLKDDLNTPQAFGVIFSNMNTALQVAQQSGQAAASLIAQDFARFLFLFGLDLRQLRLTQQKPPMEIETIAEKRWAAKQAKDFAGADALRKELTAAGWSMLDGKDSYKLEPIKK